MGNVVNNVTADAFGAACSYSKLYSAFAYILPYMEQGAGYNAYNFLWAGDLYPNAATSGPNVTAGTQLVSAYLCPSDQPAAQANPTQYTIAVSQASYGMNRGRIENLYFNWYNSAGVAVQYGNTCGYGGGDGMFMPEGVVRVADVTDGTSNTFLMGEMTRFPNEQGSSAWMWANLAMPGATVAGGLAASGSPAVRSSSPRRTRQPTRREPSRMPASPTACSLPTG